jgi:NAD-specific glutamate dehydrogenase
MSIHHIFDENNPKFHGFEQDRWTPHGVELPPLPPPHLNEAPSRARGGFMSTSAQASRLLKLANAHGVPKGTNSALFKAFIRSASPQIRSAFLVRHSDVEIFQILLELFTSSQLRTTSKPLVQIKSTEAGIFIQSHMPDQPFIVDTVLLTLRTEGIPYQSGFNLVLGMGRDNKGKLESVDEPANELESLIYVETEGTENIKGLQKKLETGLKLAQATVSDFKSIDKLIRSTAMSLMKEAESCTDEQDDLLEAAAFCRWMLADNFVFMGAIHGKTRLGIANRSVAKLNDMTFLEKWDESSDLVQIRKAETESRVHRAGRKDEIRIQLNDGSPILLQGLFTYRAVTQPSQRRTDTKESQTYSTLFQQSFCSRPRQMKSQ